MAAREYRGDQADPGGEAQLTAPVDLRPEDLGEAVVEEVNTSSRGCRCPAGRSS